MYFFYNFLDNFSSVPIVGARVLVCVTAQVVKIIVDIRMYLESIISVSRRLNTADACISILWKCIVSTHNRH